MTSGLRYGAGFALGGVAREGLCLSRRRSHMDPRPRLDLRPTSGRPELDQHHRLQRSYGVQRPHAAQVAFRSEGPGNSWNAGRVLPTLCHLRSNSATCRVQFGLAELGTTAHDLGTHSTNIGQCRVTSTIFGPPPMPTESGPKSSNSDQSRPCSTEAGAGSTSFDQSLPYIDHNILSRNRPSLARVRPENQPKLARNGPRRSRCLGDPGLHMPRTWLRR